MPTTDSALDTPEPVRESAPLPDPLEAILLPAGLSDPAAIPVPLDAKGQPVDLVDTLDQLAQAALAVDKPFDQIAVRAAAAAELEDFKARATIDGILTIAPEALEAKRAQIHGRREREAREAVARWQQWTAVTGRLLHETRARLTTVRPHAAERPEDHLAAVRDLLEAERADRWFDTLTLSELVSRYEREPDHGNRAFLGQLEAGRRPTKTAADDGPAAVLLQGLIKARRAARLTPEWRERVATFQRFTSGIRPVKLALLADGSATRKPA